MVRWPGGLFADGYRWEDGVGPPEKRPVRRNYWARLGKRLGPPETNRFGTDEFLGFCRTVGTEPYVNVNVGSGTVVSPVYRTFELYRDGEGEGVAADVASPTYDAHRLEGLRPRRSVPMLDASAVRNGNALHLFVIHRHPSQPVEAEVDAGVKEFSWAGGETIAADPWARNTPEEPERVAVRDVEPPRGPRFTYRFPPASATRFDFVV